MTSSNGNAVNRATLMLSLVGSTVAIGAMIVGGNTWVLGQCERMMDSHRESGEHPQVRQIYETKEAAGLRERGLIDRLDRIEKKLDEIRRK